MYFGLVKKYKEQYGVNIYAYNLMPSHLHLLLEVDEKTTISSVMHNINSIYTKYYNNKYERKGHLFRERFKAALIEKDPKVLLNLTAYMHLSAKKMEIAIQGKAQPDHSYSLYLDYEQNDDHGLAMKKEIETVLSGLVAEDYAQFLQKTEKVIDFKKIHKQLQRKGMFGSDAFIEQVKKKVDEARGTNHVPKKPKQEKKQPKEKTKKVDKLNPVGIAILIIALTATGIYFYFDYAKDASKQNKVEVINNVVAEEKNIDLDNTEWELKLLDSKGREVSADTLYFNKGKVISSYLSRINYAKSNYSQVQEDGKIVWQTMQKSATGTASWRGEVKNNKMSGILSLRQKGKQTQVFSFKSIKFRKKIGGLK